MITNLTHYDLDGIACHILLYNLFGKDIKVYKTGYDKIPKVVDTIITEKNVMGVKNLIITDISLEQKFVDRIVGAFGNNCFLIDHHESTTKVDLSSIRNVVNTNLAGCALVFQTFKEKLQKLSNYKELSLLTKYADAYDMWRIEKEDFKYGYTLNSLFWAFHWDEFFNRFKYGFSEFTNDEIQIRKESIEDIKKKIDESFKLDLKNQTSGKCGLFLATENISSIINDTTLILKNYDVYFGYNPKNLTISLRCRTGKNMHDVVESISKDSNYIDSFGGHVSAMTLHLKPIDEVTEDIDNVLNDLCQKILFYLN